MWPFRILAFDNLFKHMWPFSKKWALPSPHLVMVLGLRSRELPSLVMIANPAGADGAVKGMAGPADQEPSAENMMTPLKAGRYVGISPAGGGCGLQVENVEAQPGEGLCLDPVMMEAAGLSEEMLRQFNQPVWRAIISMDSPAEDARETVIFATQLAKRLAALSEGIVMDTCGFRFFGPGGWCVEDPVGDFDIREHVNIHIETGAGQATDPRWIHTHGLLKFGRPELELYDVPADMETVAVSMLVNTAHYVVDSEPILPGQTCGDPNQPFYAREGNKNQKDHWEGRAVLELVDLDERNKPVHSGAPKALQAFSALE